MRQLELKTGRQVNVDGILDEKRNIQYFGKAWEMMNGSWRCLAGVSEVLCIVEVKITLEKTA